MGVLPLTKLTELERNMGSIRSFLSHYGQSKALVIHPGNTPPQVLSDRLAITPLAALV
jgi:hypothetical protein